MENSKNALLGKEATDKVTGYKGKITAVCEYLHEATRALVADIDNTGRPIDVWFPLEQLQITNNNVEVQR